MKVHILIVDDEQSMCDFLEDGIRRAGFEVTSRTRGDEALAFVREHNVDAVVTDVRMRSMSGIDLCQELIEREPNLPVIVITAFGSMETAVEALRAGAHDFVTKPLDIRVLVHSIERAVDPLLVATLGSAPACKRSHTSSREMFC